MWNLVNTTRHYLQKGYSTVTLRDGDFFFCYFLWFENETVRYQFIAVTVKTMKRQLNKILLISTRASS